MTYEGLDLGTDLKRNGPSGVEPREKVGYSEALQKLINDDGLIINRKNVPNVTSVNVKC